MLNFNEQKKQTIIAGVPASAQAYFIAQSLLKTGPLHRSVICLLEAEEDLHAFKGTLKTFAPNISSLVFPAWDCLPYDKVSPSFSCMAQRISTLAHLFKNSFQVVITTPQAISTLLPSVSLLGENLLSMEKNQKSIRPRLLNYLSTKGYVRVDMVHQVGEYAVRGSLIDLYSASTAHPLRLDFFDDDLESIKTFSLESQLSLTEIPSFELTPVSEVILTPETIAHFRHHYREIFGTSAQKDPLYQSISGNLPFDGMEHWLPLFYDTCTSLFDYLKNPLVIFNPRAWQNFEAFCAKVHSAYDFRQDSMTLNQDFYRPIDPKSFYESEVSLKKKLSSFHQIELSPFNPKGAQDFGARALHTVKFKHENRNETYQSLKKHLSETSKKVVFAASSPGTLDAMKITLDAAKIQTVSCDTWQNTQEQEAPTLMVLPLAQGFETQNFQIITEEDLYGAKLSKKKPSNLAHKKKNLLEISQFQEGDFLIHEEYGIGSYAGLVTLTIQQAQHDCVCLVYADGDKLYVPVENLYILSFYAHKFSSTSLDKLGTSAWQARKARAQEKIKEIAEKLAKVAAQRLLVEAIPYSADGAFQEFCQRFPYPETDDQSRTIEEVIGDLAQPTPMDRLVCGDVGFGKTEVALRASFLVAHAGAQVAVLAPTTILARQHFDTFQRRFKGFPLKVRLISRFQSSSEAKKIRDEVSKGEVSILIGTHSLLSSTTKFKDLGLLIIDEEQHFGVAQKEKIKSLYPHVHLLALSATPIPRTLQMAISGIRDLSLITTPPIERLPVHTWVMPYDDLAIKEALLREHKRGGQSFFVCPRVADLGPVLRNLTTLLPSFKLAVAHGGLPSKELEQIMIDFCDRRYDVLIATNIIESGLDIPSANTLIVYRADLFGLSQIYQLRGRVGRAKNQGYAYFTFTPDKVLTQTAERRLEVLQSLRSLGASFQVASYDMDIRGSGNIMGDEQSGQIENVGVGLYHHMLEEALAELKANPDKPITLSQDWAPQISLGLEVLIPPSYIPDDGLRLSLYRRISELGNEEETENFRVEMVDRFGPLPVETDNLIQIVSLRNLCKDLNIHKLESGPHGVLVTFYKNTFLDAEKMMRFIKHSSGTVKVRPDQKLVILKAWKTPNHVMKGMTAVLNDLKEA